MRFTMILFGANGSLASNNSTVQKRIKSTAKATSDASVSLSDQDMLPPLSRPKRRKNIEETRASAPTKSMRLNLAQRSASDGLGSLRPKVTAIIAMTVAGTWSKNDLC